MSGRSLPGVLSTYSGQVQRVADPQANPIVSRHNRSKQQLGNIQLEKQREERVGVHIERVWPLDVLICRVRVCGVGQESI